MVTIRPATAADIAVVPLIYSSGPEMFSFLFDRYDRTAMSFIERCFISGKGFYGYENQWLAEVDGQVLGSMTIYSGVEHATLERQMSKPLFRHYGPINVMRVLRDVMATEHWILPPPKDTEYLANLGVAPEARGKGVGTALLEFGLQRAAQRGKAHFALDVADTNPHAERLYRRFGMTQEWEKAYSRKADIPKMRRLSMVVPQA